MYQATTALSNATQQQLRQFVEQLERLHEDRKGISDDITDKFAEMKACGFDVKVVRAILRLRKKSKVERDEATAVLETYMHALGMLSDEGTPLGEYRTRAELSAAAGGGPDNLAKLVASYVDARKRGSSVLMWGYHVWTLDIVAEVLREYGRLGEADRLIAGEKLQSMAKEDGAQTTISINGGPEVPLDVAVAAMNEVKRRGSRPRSTPQKRATEGVIP